MAQRIDTKSRILRKPGARAAFLLATASCAAIAAGAAQAQTQGNSRVVGGENASIKDWSSLVLVSRKASGQDNGSNCGGTVIAPQWVLTAGHCIRKGAPAGNYSIIEGTDDLSAGGRRVAVDRVILHENYRDSPAPSNDVALLHLRERAQAPAQTLLGGALTQSVLTPGVDARIAGFGYTNAQPVFGQHSGTGSPRLKQVTLPLIARDECIRIVAQAYDKPASGFSHIDAATVCAGDIAGGRDSCNGDSGGPLSLDIDNRRVQVGIVSWGPGCAVKNTVGVYASVPYFEPWIKQRVPDAVFVTRREQTPPRPTPGPAPTPSTEPCELPPARAASPGLLVDIAEGNRVPVGTPIHIRVSSHLQGQVAVLNVDTQTCRAYQVFPNKHSSASLPTGVGAVTIPGPNDAFVIKVNPPTGRNRLYAIAVSPDARVSDILMRGADMRSVPDVRSLWREIEARVSPRAQSTTPFAMFEYTIAQ